MYHRLWIVTAILLLCTVFSPAQIHWQIIRIFPDTLSADRIDSISTGLIYARIGSASLPIPIDSITALVFCTESHFWTAALITGAMGALIGGSIGLETSRSGDIENIIESGVTWGVIGGALGFTVGGILGSAKERRYDLEGMSDEMIQSVIRKEQE